jgi:hypothetical protein
MYPDYMCSFPIEPTGLRHLSDADAFLPDLRRRQSSPSLAFNNKSILNHKKEA